MGTEAVAARERPRGDLELARVDSLNYDGRGVARVDGRPVFIEGALPGEQVRFRYHNKRPKYATGAAVEILEPSPERVAPPCPHFGVCGGCSLQHMEAGAQLRAKQSVLAENLAHIAGLEPAQWLAPLAGPAWGYRRKARLGARLVPKKGGVLVGFREKRSSFITPLERCLTLDPAVSALLPALRELIAGLSIPHRIPQVEVAVGDNARALVFRHLEPLSAADLAALRGFAADHGVQVHLQPGGPDSVRPLAPAEPEPLRYALPAYGLEVYFGPTDFVQVNAEVNRKMVDQALALLAPGPQERVLELFAGVGNFTLPLGRRAGSVLGIEGDAALVAWANDNARRNGLENVRFQHADLYRDVEHPPWGGERFDKLLLDPPRTGAMEILKHLPADGPERIVYVSCYPATLARDSEYLVRVRGYRLQAAGVMDMFPQTSHVESMALFERT